MELEHLTQKDYAQLMGKSQCPGINQNHIIFSFFDFECHPDKFTELIGIEPTKVGLKGDEYCVGTNKQNIRIHECNFWEYEWKIFSNDFIGDIVDEYFNEVIIPNQQIFKEISLQCDMTQILIVQYYYTGFNPGIGFDREQIRILADIGAVIEVDLYCLSQDDD